jgi:hypothetical protein
MQTSRNVQNWRTQGITPGCAAVHALAKRVVFIGHACKGGTPPEEVCSGVPVLGKGRLAPGWSGHLRPVPYGRQRLRRYEHTERCEERDGEVHPLGRGDTARQIRQDAVE